ncbi:MAG: alpha/beta fold hydrolase [Pseudomonadota bacterium]
MALFGFKSRLAILALTTTLAACGDTPVRHDPPPGGIATPDAGMDFDTYVAQSRTILADRLRDLRFSPEGRPFGDYSLEEVVDMRAPNAVKPNEGRCAEETGTREQGEGVGFLLVHGLSDGPYLMTDIRDALHDAFPCSTLHSVVLPGHGTVPGDLKKVDHDAWRATVRYGMNSFDNDIDTIIPVGYSMGAALITRDHADISNGRRASSLILLAPGFAARSDMAWLTPYARYVQSYVGTDEDRDAAKYESLAMNAAAEFHLLTAPFRDDSLPNVDIPVFMAVSSDDRTIQPDIATQFFCNKVVNPQRQMIWYQGVEPDIANQPVCGGIDVIDSPNDTWRTLNHAHTAMTMRPENPHYGLDGRYRNCTHYEKPDLRTSCQSDSESTVYGELNLKDSATPGTLRRGTFNPDFGGMMGKMVVFIKQSLAPDA